MVKVLAGTGQQSRPQSLLQKALGITVFVDNHRDPSLGASLTLLLVTQWGTTEKPLKLAQKKHFLFFKLSLEHTDWILRLSFYA